MQRPNQSAVVARGSPRAIPTPPAAPHTDSRPSHHRQSGHTSTPSDIAHHTMHNKTTTHNNTITVRNKRERNRSRHRVRTRSAGLLSVNRTSRAECLLESIGTPYQQTPFQTITRRLTLRLVLPQRLIRAKTGYPGKAVPQPENSPAQRTAFWPPERTPGPNRWATAKKPRRKRMRPKRSQLPTTRLPSVPAAP